MKIFIDTADLSEVARGWEAGVGDGVTTNPSLLKKAGFEDPVAAWKKIIGLIKDNSIQPLPLSVEVFCDQVADMLVQARTFVKELNYLGTTVKIPILNTNGDNCLSAIKVLSEGGIAVNCTACVHWFQAFCAAKAGARFVSLLYGRSNDAGLDGLDMIARTRQLIDLYSLRAEIIVGSIREAKQVFDVYQAGAHIVTVPPKFFPELLFHQKSVDTQRQFLADAGVQT